MKTHNSCTPKKESSTHTIHECFQGLTAAEHSICVCVFFYFALTRGEKTTWCVHIQMNCSLFVFICSPFSMHMDIEWSACALASILSFANSWARAYILLTHFKLLPLWIAEALLIFCWSFGMAAKWEKLLVMCERLLPALFILNAYD